jgi:uncharacterized protein (UPF0248 family)
MVYETLNRLKWTGKLDRCEITVLHRGAPGDRMVISGRDLTAVRKSCFYYRKGSSGREVLIPLHRVMEIRSGGEKIWERKTSKE